MINFPRSCLSLLLFCVQGYTNRTLVYSVQVLLFICRRKSTLHSHDDLGSVMWLQEKKKQSLMDLLFPSPFSWRIYVRIWASSAGVLECNINCVHYRETQSPASAKKNRRVQTLWEKCSSPSTKREKKKKTACREKRKEEGGEACGRPGRWVQS